MSIISVRLPEILLQQIALKAKNLHLSRTEYIRKAIELMNAKISQQEQNERLKQVSLRVRKESMGVNAEFSKVEHDPEV